MSMITVFAVTACSNGDPASAPPSPTQKQTAQPTPGAPSNAQPDLKRFYGQRLSWGDCGPFAGTQFAQAAFKVPGVQCAYLTVPLDYAHPNGDTAKIGVIRKPATGANRIGSLVINPGGPGVSGMEAAASMSSQPPMAAVNSRFDLVGFDPRGIGASKPQIHCLTDQEEDADRADDLEEDGTAKGVVKAEQFEKDFATKCAQRTDHGVGMLANMGTRDVARDMDVLRAALGDRKLTYLGYSYGTRLGYTYAEQFGKNVRAMILDGAVDPNQDSMDELIGQAKGFKDAFDDYSAWCVGQPDCALGRDKAKTAKAFQDLVRPLLQTKLTLQDGRKLSYDDATTAAIYALYDKTRWKDLNTGLNDLRSRRGDTLMHLSDEYNERGTDGHYSTTNDAFSAVHCVDDPPVTDKRKIFTTHTRYAKTAPFLDNGRKASSARDACAFWPAKPTSKPHLPKVKGVPAPLVISTTRDPATPYKAGVQLARAMKGHLLTYEGTQHTAFGQGISCVDKIGDKYLIDGKLPGEPQRCGP